MNQIALSVLLVVILFNLSCTTTSQRTIDDALNISIGRDTLHPQFLTVTLENSIYKAVIRPRERHIKVNGPFDHAIRDWVLKSKNQDQVDVCIDGSAHRYACDRATIIRDESQIKTVRLEYGDAYVNHYTIFANNPHIRVDYLKYDIPSDDGDWCNIVDIGTPGGLERFEAETRLYGQDDWSRPLTYHEAPYWSIYYRADKEIYTIIDDSSAGSLNYRNHFIMTVSNSQTGVGFGRIIPIYRAGQQGGVRILKLLWDVGFEPFISTGQGDRQPITSYVFVFDNGAENAMHNAQLFLDEQLENKILP